MRHLPLSDWPPTNNPQKLLKPSKKCIHNKIGRAVKGKPSWDDFFQLLEKVRTTCTAVLKSFYMLTLSLASPVFSINCENSSNLIIVASLWTNRVWHEMIYMRCVSWNSIKDATKEPQTTIAKNNHVIHSEFCPWLPCYVSRLNCSPTERLPPPTQTLPWARAD